MGFVAMNISGINLNSPVEGKTVSIERLGFNHVLYIFYMNAAFVFSMILLSITGLHFVMIFKVLTLIGQGPSLSGIESSTYYLSSFIHGFFELLLCYIVLKFSIMQFKLVYENISEKKDKISIKQFYKNFIKKTCPLILIILFISAMCEVYISNPLIIKLTSV
ncbi:stage II sporulation protein M [Bacillus xiapuensis]|uniref:stage II sporulation protein M n=1 Tax=Bacillus xiapuensis TaxID=2014075 RepID=UPI001E55DCE5|nr:stage II sporulation protein M [Bacillus xiapuensis]